eukprot:NODE_216_length_14242_cov_0.417592.p3 type:complete len:350 gc:universal NODE_216_length_14242_cov_0.417592:10261-11310(+)
MEILSKYRNKYLNFDDYQAYAKTLTKRIKKERKRSNLHAVNLLSVEKNLSLGLMHQHRHLKLKKLRRAYQIGSKMTLSNLESIYFHCVAGLYLTYAKDYINAHRDISTALSFFNSSSYKLLNESLIEFFTASKQLCVTSLRQVDYQLQLLNIRTPIADTSDKFMLDASQSICQVGSKSFYCESSLTLQLTIALEEGSNISEGDLSKLHASVIKSNSELKYDSLEKQYLTMWTYLYEGITDMSYCFSSDDISAGKSVYRFIKRFEYLRKECSDLLAENHKLLNYCGLVESELDSIYNEIKEGRYSKIEALLARHNLVSGLPKLLDLQANEMRYARVEVIINNVENGYIKI